MHASQLTGEIPASLNTLSKLRSLNLRNNSLSGTIPDLGSLDSLTHLRLHRNALSGSIPASLGGLEKLQELYLHGNALTGMIPAELDALADTLVKIDLRENNFDAVTMSAPKGPAPIARLTTPRALPLISLGARSIVMAACMEPNPDTPIPMTRSVGSEKA